MNGFGIELIKMMISQKKYSSITDCTKIMYPDKNTNLVIQEHVGDDIRVYKENGTINILCPEKMTVVQEGALAKAIENGTIFDDADTVDNGAKCIELTTLPYKGMCNKGIDMPEKLHKMTSIVIGKMDDDGRCGQCDIDLDTGNKFYKDMINHVDNNMSVADVVTHYVGNKDGFLNNDLRRDMRGVRDEIERVQGIDHEATVSDDDWEYMSMDDPVGESTSPTDFQEGFLSRRPKKLKPIPRDVVAYITVEMNAIKDSNDQAMLAGYTCSKLELVDFYITVIDTQDSRYIVPHTRDYLVRMQTELNDLLTKILKIKPINRNDRVWKVNLPEEWRG